MLEDFGLTNCATIAVPLRTRITSLPEAQANSLPDISDDDLTAKFQHLNGRLPYCAKTTRPDIDYATTALAQFNAKASRKHLLASKSILRYLLDPFVGDGLGLTRANTGIDEILGLGCCTYEFTYVYFEGYTWYSQIF